VINSLKAPTATRSLKKNDRRGLVGGSTFLLIVGSFVGVRRDASKARPVLTLSRRRVFHLNAVQRQLAAAFH